MAEKRPSGVSAKVFDAFLKNPDQILSIFDLIRLTGLKQQQIQNSISNLRGRNGMTEIEAIIKGSAYRYNTGYPTNPNPVKPEQKPEPEPEPELTDDDDWIELRMVGTNKAGRAIVEDEDGKLYTLEEL